MALPTRRYSTSSSAASLAAAGHRIGLAGAAVEVTLENLADCVDPHAALPELLARLRPDARSGGTTPPSPTRLL